jgi:preprotein translocase subunit SecD
MLKSLIALGIFLAAASLVSQPAVAGSAAVSCPRFEIAIVDDQAKRAIPDEDGSIVHVDSPSLLTTADFTGADVSLTDGQIVLNINLSHEAGLRIQAFSREHVGVKLAFILDDHAVKVARILDPIHKDGILMGPFARAEADKLAASINGTPRNCRAK